MERTDEFKNMLRLRIQIIEQKLDKGEDVMQEVIEFNLLTGREYAPSYFRDYWTFMSIDDFVIEACSPIPKRILDITKEELIEIVRRAKDCETYGQNSNFYTQLFEANVVMPEASNLIFWSKEQLTPEQVVKIALSYKPIVL